METNRESKALNKKLEAQINPEISDRLKELQALWIDSELFAQFEQRIKKIIWENPWSEEVVVWELQKTWLTVETLVINSNRKFRSILNNAANDDFYQDVA